MRTSTTRSLPNSLVAQRIEEHHELLGSRLCRLGLHPCRVRQQPIQDDGCAPGLLGGAEGLACERLEVLGEATFGDLIEACPTYPGGAIGFPGPPERPPEEPAHDRPNGAAPIASRMEPLLAWTGRGRQRPVQHRITRRVWRVEGQE